MKRVACLQAGGALMVLLGLARGAGGLVLLIRGPAADAAIVAGHAAVRAVAAGLAALGLALVVSAIGVLRRSRLAWVAGVVFTIVFVAGGAVNGLVLYGRPGEAGTLVNAAVAGLILVLLVSGRGALDEAASDGAARSGRRGTGLPCPGRAPVLRGSVTFDEEWIRCTAGGETQELRWDALERVEIRTTDQGPFVDDVFFVLRGRGRTVLCPSEADGSQGLLARLQQLPGFDNDAVIEAMTCTENRVFLCWERPQGPASPS